MFGVGCQIRNTLIAFYLTLGLVSAANAAIHAFYLNQTPILRQSRGSNM